MNGLNTDEVAMKCQALRNSLRLAQITMNYDGGHHMVFSGYSLPLQLAYQAESWDGDVIAEDTDPATSPLNLFAGVGFGEDGKSRIIMDKQSFQQVV